MADPLPILAGIVFQMGAPVNDLMAKVRAHLSAQGVAIGGICQDSVWDEASGQKTLVVREINGAWELPILEYRGKEARGCRLDPQAITDLSHRLDMLFGTRPDLMMINRFGRAESESRGLRDVFERAALEHIPLLVAVREDYCDAWRAFHGGMGLELPMDEAAVYDWWRNLEIQRQTTGNPHKDTPAITPQTAG